MLSWFTLETGKDEDMHLTSVLVIFETNCDRSSFFFVLFFEEILVTSYLLVSVWLSESGSNRTEQSWVVSRFLISMLTMHLEAARTFSRLIRCKAIDKVRGTY